MSLSSSSLLSKMTSFLNGIAHLAPAQRSKRTTQFLQENVCGSKTIKTDVYPLFSDNLLNRVDTYSILNNLRLFSKDVLNGFVEG